MRDDLDPRDARAEGERTPTGEAPAHPEQEPTLTDREVPLRSAHTPEAIHAWLDGESVNEEQLRAAEKEYSFWRRVEQEAGRRRRVKTPSALPDQIMKAIKKDE
ncbi:MAG TPA: hypothetical protein VIH11_03530 [Gemmatimonadaceae bacterium]